MREGRQKKFRKCGITDPADEGAKKTSQDALRFSANKVSKHQHPGMGEKNADSS